jgi:hypothetical protein
MGTLADPIEAVPSIIRRAVLCLTLAPLLSEDVTRLTSREENSVNAVSSEVSEAVEYVDDAEEIRGPVDIDRLPNFRGIFGKNELRIMFKGWL